MSEKERKEIATCISSILTSTPKRMTVYTLNSDFANTVGYKIPYQKFGCVSLEQFLRTLKDKVQVNGTGEHAEVQVIISDKVAHINDLIANQRPAKQRLRQNYRSYRNRPIYRSFFSYSNHYNSQVSRASNTSNANKSITNGININVKSSGNTNVTGSANTNIRYEKVNLTTVKSNVNTSSGRQNITNRGAIPKYSTDVTDADELFFSDGEDNTRIPQSVQDNLKKLIIKHSDGIWSSNMLEFYRKEYGKPLSYSEYGYRSVAQMCADLRNIFSIVTLDKSDIKLFDKNKPIPKDTLNIVKKLQLMKVKASVETTTENAIPDAAAEELMSEIYSEKMPQNVVPFGFTLERQWIDPGVCEQDYIDVNIGEVYDPSKFWLNLKLYAGPLNGLMDNMQSFYMNNKDKLKVPYLALRKDMYIACIFAREYHRARIVDTSQKDEYVIKAYFIDYGTVSVVSIESICYLHTQFAELPEQAIRARLAGIYPPSENEQWSRAAASQFLKFVMQKDLVAQLIKIDEERRILDIVLADTSEAEEDFFLNDALVTMGFARFTFQDRKEAEPGNVVPIVRYIHLFPTHNELENGLVPTATQMISMHQAGLCIEQIHPHYYKNYNTDLPIKVAQVFNTKTENYMIDYEMEESYFDPDNQNEICDEPSNFDTDNMNNKSETNWGDFLEKEEKFLEKEEFLEKKEEFLEKEYFQSATNEQQSSPKNSDFENYSSDENNINVAENNELRINTSKKENVTENLHVNIQEESLQSSNSSTSTQTDSTQSESATNTSIETVIIGKPLRPPPGFGKPNVTINNNVTPQPNNYLASQTYINMPMCYYTQMQPPYYSYVPYGNQYIPMDILQRLSSMVSGGVQLTPEQQTYNANNNQYSSPQCFPNNQMQNQYVGLPMHNDINNKTCGNQNMNQLSHYANVSHNVANGFRNNPHAGYENQSYLNPYYSNQLYQGQPYSNQPYSNQPYPNQSHLNQYYSNPCYSNQSYSNQSTLSTTCTPVLSTNSMQTDNQLEKCKPQIVDSSPESKNNQCSSPKLRSTPPEKDVVSVHVDTDAKNVDNPLVNNEDSQFHSHEKSVHLCTDTKSLDNQFVKNQSLTHGSAIKLSDIQVEEEEPAHVYTDPKSLDTQLVTSAHVYTDSKILNNQQGESSIDALSVKLSNTHIREKKDDKSAQIISTTENYKQSRVQSDKPTVEHSNVLMEEESNTEVITSTDLQSHSDTEILENPNTRTAEDIVYTKNNNNQIAIGISGNLSDISSNYEDCDSSSVRYYSDPYDIIKTNMNFDEVKFIKVIHAGKLCLHVIHYDKDFYFLLTELSEKLFGSLSVIQIRRLFVGSSYPISAVDIRLKTNPQLKKELLLYDLIAENESAVDALHIKQLEDLTKTIPPVEDQIDNINVLLKEIDLILS